MIWSCIGVEAQDQWLGVRAELGSRERRGCHRMVRPGLGMCYVDGDLSDLCVPVHRFGLGHEE